MKKKKKKDIVLQSLILMRGESCSLLFLLDVKDGLSQSDQK